MTIPWGAIGSWIGNNAGTIANLGMSLYGSNQQKKATQQAVKQATPIPYSSSSMFGNVNFDPKSHTMNYSMANNPFAQLLNVGGVQAFGNAFSAPGSAYYGAAPEVVAAANAMGGDAQAAEAQNRYDLLTQYAQPESNRMFQRLENNLFARGQMGTTGGGEHYRGFYEAQNQADLARQMAAQDWAQQRSLSRFDVARNAVGQGMTAQGQNFNMGTGAMGGLQSLFSQLLQQGQSGIGAGAGTPGGVALANASASNIPYQVGAEFLSNSGIFDALGRWIGNKTSPTPTIPTPAPGTTPGPWAGGYVFPSNGG